MYGVTGIQAHIRKVSCQSEPSAYLFSHVLKKKTTQVTGLKECTHWELINNVDVIY